MYSANVALHLGTPYPEFNASFQTVIESAIRAVGGDPNDPRTTWDFTTFQVSSPSLIEDVAGNPLPVALLILALILVIHYRGLSRNTIIAVIGLLLAFILFCLLFKWQPWHTRLHLPLFVLSAAIIAVVLERAWPPSATTALGALLLVTALPFLLTNQLRPLVSATGKTVFSTERTAQYFASNSSVMADYVKNC